MKLEFIPDGWESGNLILFWGGEPPDAAALARVFRQLATEINARINLHELAFIQTIGELSLVAVSCNDESGLVADGSPRRLRWSLKPESWDNVEGLMEPFAEPNTERGGHQFLNPGPGSVVIYSTRRSW